MIEPINLQNVYSVGRIGPGAQLPGGKKDPGFPIVQPPGASDVVQISSDAALKSKLGAFSAALYKELNETASGRIEKLKEQYAGDLCPVGCADIAGAIMARFKAEGFANE